jgi:rhodanese-related sulfurtransferase
MALPNLRAEAQTHHSSQPAFDAELTRLLSFTIPTMSVEELQRQQAEVLIFDTREKGEYEVSHLPGARYLGYEHFEASRLSGVPKGAKIVLYCSVGYRSEKIGERLKRMGFTQVFNLYGSIFEWVNHGFPVEKSPGRTTYEVHTYNAEWSHWVNNPKMVKQW